VTSRRARRYALTSSATAQHAVIWVEAPDCKRLEQLCRYITRPALSDERVHLDAVGQVKLKLETPWRDGTTNLVMLPLKFMQRRIERRLLGSQICERYGSNGSRADAR
jgi:Putative transposase